MSKINNWMLKKYAAVQLRKAEAAEEGQGLVEYGLILALIAVVCIGLLTLMGTSIKGTLQSVVDGLAGGGA